MCTQLKWKEDTLETSFKNVPVVCVWVQLTEDQGSEHASVAIFFIYVQLHLKARGEREYACHFIDLNNAT